MLPLLLAVAGALATARLTRLVTADQLTLPLRRRVLQRVPVGGRLEYLLSCSWCTSMWTGTCVAAVVVAQIPGLRTDAVRALVSIGLLALAYSHLTGRWARTEVEV